MSDLVGNPKDRISRIVAQFRGVSNDILSTTAKIFDAKNSADQLCYK